MKRILNKIMFLLHTDAAEYQEIIFLRTLALSLVGVFIPLYIYSHGGGLLLIALFTLTYGLTSILAAYIIPPILKEDGTASAMLASVILFVMGLMVLNEYSMVNVLIAAIFLRTSEMFFWVPMHALYPHMVRKGGSKKYYSLEMAVILLTPFLGPLIGALIIDIFGYFSLFLLSAFVYLLAIFPLKDISTHHLIEVHYPHSLKTPYYLEGFRAAGLAVYWPLFLFAFVLFRIDEVAAVNSFIAITGGITSLLIALKLKDGLRNLAGKIGAYLHALSVMLRSFSFPFSITSIISGLAAIFYAFMQPVYMSIYYGHVAKDKEEVLRREVSIGLGYASTGLIVFLMWAAGFIKPSVATVIFLSSFASLYVAGMIKDKEGQKRKKGRDRKKSVK